jgi:diguanylate cyclase (GGDEF)-like protein
MEVILPMVRDPGIQRQSHTRAQHPPGWRLLATALSALVVAASVCLATWLEGQPITIRSGVLALLGVAAMLALGGWLLRNARRYHLPLRELEDTLAGVRDGSLPIEELGRLEGPLRPLALQALEMARELRLHRAELQQVQGEIHQLVAQRTDALEQKLGALRVQASHDPLTGLHNRRAFDRELDQVVEQAQRDGADVGLLMIDLDNFKLLNDTQGHAAGDEFLRDVGQIIRSGIRRDDVGFRYGGDEFVVLMPGACREESEALGQRLVGLIDSLGRPLHLSSPVGASAGLAMLRELPERSAANLLQEADRRQYAAKLARRGPASAVADGQGQA